MVFWCIYICWAPRVMLKTSFFRLRFPVHHSARTKQMLMHRKSCLVPIANLRADHSHVPTVRAFGWKSCYDLFITYSNPLFLNYLHWQITTILLQKDLCLSKACQKKIFDGICLTCRHYIWVSKPLSIKKKISSGLLIEVRQTYCIGRHWFIALNMMFRL